MRNSLIKKQAGLAVACAFALGLVSATASAQTLRTPLAEDSALLTSEQGSVMSPFGMCWRSGHGPRAAPSVLCDPNYDPALPARAVAPAAAPIVVAAAAPLYEKVSLDANVLFDSDKAALRPAGRDALDDFIKRTRGVEPATMMAVGYADRMGSDSANQVLSEERVAAVKSYLVGKGIASSQVQTSAKGETLPSTKAGECGEANNAKNIACLQPDRHVFIQASGTRLKQ
jgi:OmpA-OmpF porin, OOP family